MAFDLQSILGYVTLTNLVKEQTDGLPKVLPEKFYNLTRPVLGDSAAYIRVPGTRNLVPRVEYGAPAVRLDQKGIGSIPVKLLHTNVEVAFNPTVLIALREYASYSPQNMGREEIARQTMSVSTRMQNFRNTAIHSALANGAIWFDSNQNLLPSSSGAALTVDYAVPAGNKNQLNVDGGGAIISASWATTTTDIPLQIRKLKKAVAKLTGYPLKYAIYGENIVSYLTANDYVLDYLSRDSSGRREQYNSTGELPDTLMGLEWIPGYEAFYEDASATNQTILPADNIIFLPEPSKEWWEVFEGSLPVPASINIAAEGMAAAENVKVVQGRGGYGRVIDNPVSIICRYFDTFLPVIKVPSAVFIADVTP